MTETKKAEEQPKTVEAHQGEQTDNEVHGQGPVHGAPKPGLVQGDLPKAVESHQGEAADGEVNAQGPIHGKK